MSEKVDAESRARSASSLPTSPPPHPSSSLAMSLADELLADFGSDEEFSDHETPAAPTPVASSSTNGAKAKPASSSGGGLMLPPSSLPQKRKALEDSLDAQPSTSALADDLMDSDDEGEEMAAGEEGSVELPSGGVRPAEELDKDAVEQMDLSDVKEVRKVAKLLGSRKLEDVLKVSPPRARQDRDGRRHGELDLGEGEDEADLSRRACV